MDSSMDIGLTDLASSAQAKAPVAARPHHNYNSPEPETSESSHLSETQARVLHKDLEKILHFPYGSPLTEA